MKPSKDGKFIEQETVDVAQVHGDLSQEIVKITLDKLSLILHKHVKSIEERKSWVAPLGIFLTIILVLVTSTFNKIIWSGDTWTAIFVMGGFLSFLWLIKSAWSAYNSESIDDLVEKIKKQE